MANYQALGDGIYCIETELYRPQMASCYLVQQGDQVAFIDTGTYYTVPLIMEILTDLNLSPAQVRYVIPTHVHLDHAGGAGELMAHCPNATLITHAKGVPHMIDPSKLQAGATAVYGAAAFNKDYGQLTPIPAERVRAAQDGEEIDLNGRKLRLLETPGHANHHICIFDLQSQSGFTGDTFGLSYREFDTENGAWIMAPTTPVAFDPDAWLNSVDRLLALQPKAMQLTHFCRITEVQRLGASLKQSIQDMSRIAKSAYASEPDAAKRKALMREQISQLLLSQTRAHGCQMSNKQILEILEIDIELNAQGLEVWLQRTAKKAA